MTLASIVIQFLNGLATASTLFLLAVGLSLIFGVSRIVNFAHGAFYALGLYVAIALVRSWGLSGITFWGAILCAGLIVACLGVFIEIFLLRRIYSAPDLFQLLATFALTLVIRDGLLWVWGPEDLLGPRAPGLGGKVEILGHPIPEYDLLLIGIGPAILILLQWLLKSTRIGVLIRAATQDREMVSALGVNQSWLFTGIFALGTFLTAIGGALQMPREPASLGLDLLVIGDAFVVVVIGGLGSIGGAYWAAVIIGITKTICLSLGTVEWLGLSFPLAKLTLVVEFLLMAAILIWRPLGLFGRAEAVSHAHVVDVSPPLLPYSTSEVYGFCGLLAVLLILPFLGWTYYTLVILTDIFILSLFAVSLHLLMGFAGLASFGHTAYFGLGAYASALLFKNMGYSIEFSLVGGMLFAALAGLLFGWFCVRLSGVYSAMLTLAFAQIVWSVVFQWDQLTGGSNGLIGLHPPSYLSSKVNFYYATLLLTSVGIWGLYRLSMSPWGYTLRAARDAPMRAGALGLSVMQVQWAAFIIAGSMAGLAGGLYAFSKGSISPDILGVSRSVDGLVMVLLGGLHTLLGPLAGATAFTWLRDTITRNTDYWQAILGGTILVLVLLFPQGLVGSLSRWLRPTK